jgi:protein-S-isoprenylcysteine O-methyltransferase Ste14
MILLKTILFTLFIPGTVVVLIPFGIYQLGWQLEIFHLGALKWLGLAPLVLGVLGLLWCEKDFIFKGRGTPMPIDAPKQLVSEGLYQYTRNPMYVSVLSILLGEAIFLQSAGLLAYFVYMSIVFHFFVTLYEEKHLKKIFGNSYIQYCSQVHRWFGKKF